MELLRSNFANCSIGPFNKKALKKAFPVRKSAFLMGNIDKILFSLGISSYSSVVESNTGNILKVRYPANRFGSLPGAQWKVDFEKSDSVLLSYKLFVPSDFDFVKGGKLPGLAGGKGNMGGEVPTGHDGWSVRFMFKEQGYLCAYLYYPDMPQQYGQKKFLTIEGRCFRIPRNQWIEIGLKVSLNSAGQKNGRVECYIDDVLMLKEEGLVFRYVETLFVDHLLFSSFFGGADLSYAPVQNCALYFKDFKVFEVDTPKI
jgi:hypothetical protein